MPEAKRFVLVNHSQHQDLELYHGRAISLVPSDPRVPFHGSFLIHEMRVRGWWPFRANRSILLPIKWQAWILRAANDDNDNNGNGNDEQHDAHDAALAGSNDATSRNALLPVTQIPPPAFTSNTRFDHQHPNDNNPFSVGAATRLHPQMFTPTNPFANPAELRDLKRSFAQQPNWKAALVEGESWEGSAEENIAKWRGLVDHHE